MNVQVNTIITFEDEKFLDVVAANPTPIVYEEVLLKDIAAHQDKKIGKNLNYIILHENISKFF